MIWPRATVPSFKSYLVWLSKQERLTDTKYWSDYFEGLEEPSLLPKIPASKSAANYKSQSEYLGGDLMERVTRVARELKITPNTILSASWALVLRRLLQQDDVVFVTTTAGRPPEIPNISQAVGAFVNTLPVRFQIDPSQSVKELLRDFARAETERRKHEFASLAEVQSCTPFPKGAPLFETMFVNEGIAEENFDFADIQVSNLQTTQFSNYPLSLLVTPQKKLRVESSI